MNKKNIPSTAALGVLLLFIANTLSCDSNKSSEYMDDTYDEPDRGTDPYGDTDLDGAANLEGATDPDGITDTNLYPAMDGATHTDGDGAADVSTAIDTNTNTYVDADMDTNPYSDANTDTDTGVTNNIDADTDADTGTGTEPDTGTDASCGANYLSEWPDNANPKTIGRKLAQLFNSQLAGVDTHYKQACTWYGSLSVGELIGDQNLVNELITKFEPYKPNFVSNQTRENHVDNSVFGIVPLEIYLHNHDTVTRDLGTAVADHQIVNIAAQKRYAVDDMFMITGLQVQAYRATEDNKYLDIAAATMVEYLNRLQRPEDGCFYHLESNTIKWGRGNGWFASGLAEILRELDTSHTHYARIRQGYEDMMTGLLGYQIQNGNGAGLWKQVLDYDGGDNWPETSGSAMFTAAMITGVKNCWLDADTFGPAARNAWLALVSYLGPDGRLREVSNWCYFQTLQEYTSRDRITGDNHGQAPMLWSAAALLR